MSKHVFPSFWGVGHIESLTELHNYSLKDCILKFKHPHNLFPKWQWTDYVY